MHKETIRYIDYKGHEREDDFYFNLSKGELAKMEMSTTGGLEETIRRIIKAENNQEIVRLFEELILKSYGVISDDGRRFIKSDQLREEFAQTEAYSELFVKLATDADAAAAFVNGIVPASVEAAAKKAAVPTTSVTVDGEKVVGTIG